MFGGKRNQGRSWRCNVPIFFSTVGEKLGINSKKFYYAVSKSEFFCSPLAVHGVLLAWLSNCSVLCCWRNIYFWVATYFENGSVLLYIYIHKWVQHKPNSRSSWAVFAVLQKVTDAQPLATVALFCSSSHPLCCVDENSMESGWEQCLKRSQRILVQLMQWLKGTELTHREDLERYPVKGKDWNQ